MGKTFEEVLLKLGWRKCTKLRVSVSSSETFSNQKTWMTKWLEKEENPFHVEAIDEKR